MKITIDTIHKTIKVEDAVNVKLLVHELRELLGDKMNEYTLMPTDIQWVNPVMPVAAPIWVIPTYPVYPYSTVAPGYPAQQPWVICSTSLGAPILPLGMINS